MSDIKAEGRTSLRHFSVQKLRADCCFRKRHAAKTDGSFAITSAMRHQVRDARAPTRGSAPKHSVTLRM